MLYSLVCGGMRAYGMNVDAYLVLIRPDERIMALSQTNIFADDKFTFTQRNITFDFRRIENSVRKGENAGNQYFLLFPQCLQKSLFAFEILCATPF